MARAAFCSGCRGVPEAGALSLRKADGRRCPLVADFGLIANRLSPTRSGSSPGQKADLRGAADLAGPGGFNELERGAKQLEILLVLGRVVPVDLNPLPRACHTTGLKWDDVAP